MSLFDSLSCGYARPSDFFSVVLEGGEILKFRAPSRDELPEIKERSTEFARGYIAKPEFSGLKISPEMRVRIFVICELLVSASKDEVELDPMPITEWARLAMTHFQLVDAIYAAIERQTSVTVLSADTHVIEEAKKKLRESPIEFERFYAATKYLRRHPDECEGKLMTREMLLEVVAFHQLIRDEVGDGGVASLLSLMF